jgi:hypothetical protein
MGKVWGQERQSVREAIAASVLPVVNSAEVYMQIRGRGCAWWSTMMGFKLAFQHAFWN